MIRLFFTKVSHYSRSIEEQREQKAILKKQKRCQSALGKVADLTETLRASTAERYRTEAATRRQRKEKGREVFLSSSRMIRRMVQHGAGDAQAWAKKSCSF